MNWAKIKAWLISKNITTQTVGAVLFAFAVAYTTSSDVRDQVATLFVGHPVIVTKIGIITGDIVILAALWAKFSHGSTPAGIVALAQDIAKSPNPPTQAAVEAAKPSTK